ncbi:quinone-dependent dihydroorotate dehydrogenase, partial [Gammaproteobacteria bacterium]|nr:quinone-dependent dihydroorotate dehydrogenase [Gammaproteobacteria bacterium]
MKFLVSLLRLLPPEIAHSLALKSLDIIYRLNLVPVLFPVKGSSSTFSYKNLIFKNRLGIAAGLDKNGDHIDSLGSLGFGFIEVGTVTPLPQEGNPKPRIFRFPFEKALINRLGFNNKGLDCMVRNLRSRKFSGIVGVNIGSNKNSEGQKRIDDYVEC